MSDASKAVFLSYAREDADAARRIADALRAFGVEVWFDQNELRGGDAWDAKIRDQIRSCTLFVPIISATTEGRREGYFRREWRLAAERAGDMGRRAAFLLPVVIDETSESRADVPDEFLRVQWIRQVRLAFSATGSTAEADAWLASLSTGQLDQPRMVELRKWRASVRGDYAEWKRLDALQPWFDEQLPRAAQAIEAALIIAAHGDKAGALARLGDFAAGAPAALANEPENAHIWRGLSLIAALGGNKEEALRAARRAIELRPATRDALSGPGFEHNLAVVYAWTGEKNRAIAELKRLLALPGGGGVGSIVNVHHMKVGADFAPLRGDPRFEALLNDPKNNQPLF